MIDSTEPELTDAQRQKLLDKLAKLKAHAESAQLIGNDAEYEAFAAAFQRILLDNKIDATEVELTRLEAEEPVEKHYINYDRYPDVPVKNVRVDWVERLASIVARAHFCRILVHPGSSRVTLVGRRSDAAVAEHMLIVLQRATKSLADKAYTKFYHECLKTDGHPRRCRGFHASFVRSFVLRLEQRYEGERDARIRADGTTHALVRVNRADAAVDAFIEGEKFDSATHNPWGFKRGIDAADQVPLRSNVVSAPAATAQLATTSDATHVVYYVGVNAVKMFVKLTSAGGVGWTTTRKDATRFAAADAASRASQLTGGVAEPFERKRATL